MRITSIAAFSLLLSLAIEAQGSGLLRGRSGNALDIVSHRVEVSIDNQIARTRVTQVFHNQSDRMLEAVYEFPLPEGAGVSEFAFWINGVRRTGVVVEKARARQVYDSIVRRKKDPALLEQVGRNTFRMSVYPVMPHADQKIELTYDEVLTVENGRCRYRYPLRLDGPTSQVREDFSLAARVRSAFPIEEIGSDSHPIDVNKKPDEVVVGLEVQQAALDKDFSLHYTLRSPELSLRVASHKGGAADGTFLAIINPGIGEDDVLEKDVILVMDTSGSMKGDKIETAKQAMRYFVETLRPGDRFNILTFATSVRRFQPTLVAAERERRDAAQAFIDQVTASGSTAIDEALGEALSDGSRASSGDPEQLRPLRVIFVTDGKPTVGVTDARDIVSNAIQRNAADARVFAFGVESEIDSRLLNLLAAKTGGRAELVVHGDQLEQVLSDFVDQIAKPVLTDIAVSVDGGQVHDVYPKTAPDLYAGGQVRIVGRYAQPGPATVRVRGNYRGKIFTIEGAVDLAGASTRESAIERLWAKRKIEYLLDELWWRQDEEKELRDEIVQLGQDARVVTPYTSMLILESEADYRRFGLTPPDDLPPPVAKADGAELWDDATELQGRIEDGKVAANSSPSSRSPSSHGGSYRGPGDSTVLGGGRGPQTPGGGPNTGGPVAGGGGAPRSPVAGRTGFLTGSGRKMNSGGEGYEQWQFWWEYNKDRYLDVRDRVYRSYIPAGFVSGIGRKNRLHPFLNASEAHERIVPILKSVLDSDDADIVDSAVLALARVVRADSTSLVIQDIQDALKNPNATAKQSAILALGVLGAKESVPLLIDIMNDTKAGREALDERSALSDLQRALAAVSLGYVGGPEAADALKAAISTAVFASPNTEIEVRSAAITALGLFEQEKHLVIPFLLDLLKDRQMAPATRAQVPIALGRLGAGDAIPEFLRVLRSRLDWDVRLHESCVIGLGRLAQPQDDDAVTLLQGIITHGVNDQTRHYAFIALAQIGARAAVEDPDSHVEFLDDLVNKFLMKELTRPKKKTHQPWAGLALAIVGRDLSLNSWLRINLTLKLLEAFEEANHPDYQAAFAIGLGLLDALSAGPAIAEFMNDTNDLELKGYLALSLGLMRYTHALPELRVLARDKRDPKMRMQAVTALGLLEDVQSVPTLIEELKHAETLNVISSLARAIGMVGNRDAIGPLQDLIADESTPGLTRAFACVALGLIGEKTRLPWNARITENANYRIVSPFLYEIADIL